MTECKHIILNKQKSHWLRDALIVAGMLTFLLTLFGIAGSMDIREEKRIAHERAISQAWEDGFKQGKEAKQ